MDNTVLPPYAPHSLSNLTTIQLLLPILEVLHAVHLTHFATSFPYLNPAHLNPLPPKFDEFHIHPWIPTDVPALTHYSRIILSLLTVNVPAHTLIFFFYIWSDPAVQLVLCRDICLLSGSWSTFCGLLLNVFPHQAQLSCTEICDTIVVIHHALHDHYLPWDTYNMAMYHFCMVYCLLHTQEFLPTKELLDLADMLAHRLPTSLTAHEHGEQVLSLMEMSHLQSTLITEHLCDLQVHLFKIMINLQDGHLLPEDFETALNQVIHCIDALSNMQNLSHRLLTTYLPAILPPEAPNPDSTLCHQGPPPEPVPVLPTTPATTAHNLHSGSPGFSTAEFSFVPPWEM